MDTSADSNINTVIFLIITSGFLVALLVRWLLSLYAKRLAARSQTTFAQEIIKAIQTPLFWSIIVLSTILSVYLLGPDPTLSRLLYNSLISVLILTWTTSFYLHLQGALQAWAVNFQTKHHRAVADAVPFLAGLFKATLLFLAIYFIFLAWGIDLTPLLAALSIIGAALSFAARDAVGNVISGVGIFLSRPFKVGDYVVIDDKQAGTVIETTLQLTKLKTPEKTVINIPNTLIVTKPLHNHNTLNSYYRLCLPFSLPINVDPNDTSTILIKAAEKNTWVLKKPLPRVRCKTPTEKQQKLELIVMLENPAKAGTVTSQIVKAVLPALQKLSS